MNSNHVAPSNSRGPESGATLQMKSPVARSAWARLIVAAIELQGPVKMEHTVESGDIRVPKDDV